MSGRDRIKHEKVILGGYFTWGTMEGRNRKSGKHSQRWSSRRRRVWERADIDRQLREEAA